MFSEYSNNFKINYASNKWYISIIESLENNILEENTELFMTLTASISESTDTSEATLVLNLPQNKEAIQFSKAYYLAQYPKEGSGVIEFEDAIEFANADDPKTITITLDSKYFIYRKTNTFYTCNIRNYVNLEKIRYTNKQDKFIY